MKKFTLCLFFAFVTIVTISAQRSFHAANRAYRTIRTYTVINQMNRAFGKKGHINYSRKGDYVNDIIFEKNFSEIELEIRKTLNENDRIVFDSIILRRNKVMREFKEGMKELRKSFDEIDSIYIAPQRNYDFTVNFQPKNQKDSLILKAAKAYNEAQKNKVGDEHYEWYDKWMKQMEERYGKKYMKELVERLNKR